MLRAPIVIPLWHVSTQYILPTRPTISHATAESEDKVAIMYLFPIELYAFIVVQGNELLFEVGC